MNLWKAILIVTLTIIIFALLTIVIVKVNHITNVTAKDTSEQLPEGGAKVSISIVPPNQTNESENVSIS